MCNIKNTIEQFRYAVDVLNEYSSEVKDEQCENLMFKLGKISAALEEVKIHYQCLLDEATESDNDKIKINKFENIQTSSSEHFLKLF